MAGWGRRFLFLTAAVLAFGILAPAVPAGAQEAGDTPSASPYLEMSLDSLNREVREARREYQAARERVRLELQDSLSTRADTVRVGELQLVARPGDLRTGIELFQQVWNEVEPLLGDYEVDLASRPILFSVGRHRDRIFLKDALNVGLNPFTQYLPGGALGAARGAVAELMAAPLPDDWSIQRLRTRPIFLERTYRSMATDPSTSVRKCLAGDGRECWIAMGVVEVEDPIEHWYTPAERRQVLASYGRSRMNRHSLEFYDSCMDDGDDAACIEGLRARAPHPPLGNRVESVAAVAMEVGGEGAYGRLLAAAADGADLRQALALAAGMEPDALAETWAARIRAARPEYRADVRTAQWATLLWVVLFGGLAMRSTRWRLG